MVGVVTSIVCVCAGSNHFGIAGYYSLMALKEGLIVSGSATCIAHACHMHETCMPHVLSMQGMATTNTSPIGFPTRAKQVSHLQVKMISYLVPWLLSGTLCLNSHSKPRWYHQVV